MKRSTSRNAWISISFPILIFITVLLVCPQWVMADAENDMLKARIEKLEKELNELKSLVKDKAEEKKEMAAVAKAPAEKPSTGFSVKPYGYIKLDAAYNDSAVTNGDYLIWVPSEGTAKNDDEINFTARQTRLGMVITAPDYNGWKTKGKFELDFFGSNANENKAEPMMRQAFVETSKGGLSFLAGQTWDVISPLNAATLNYVAGFSSGNNGYRRAQLRVSYNSSLGNDTSLLSQFALARTSGSGDIDGGGQNDGDDSGLPTLQARVALTTKGAAGKKMTVGISGHYGQEEVDWGTGTDDLNSWSGNVDFSIPLSSILSLKGEVFYGDNLDDYYGGILQGVDSATRNEITSAGMWAQLNYVAGKKMQYYLGYGFDNPDTDDLSSPSARDKNTFYYLTALYKAQPNLTLGFEYTYYETEYKGLADGKANRFQTSVIYSW